MKKSLPILVGILMILATVPPAHGYVEGAVMPISGEVVGDFDPPEVRWGSGHRGVDIAGSDGQMVVAAMDGIVSFAGMVAGRPVITVDHGLTSTTYEPVDALVDVGDWVGAGHAIGHLIAGHACARPVCLHWGLRDGETYLNPLSLLGRFSIRLIGAAAMDEVRARAEYLASVGVGDLSAAGLINPATGTVSSPFGMRIHPIDGVARFHSGIDIAASCGTPLFAVASGVVSSVSYSAGYGNWLVIDHGLVQGRTLTTLYAHAEAFGLGAGTPVTQGQIIGWIGSTGASTGCHVHFETEVAGALVDPASLLP